MVNKGFRSLEFRRYPKDLLIDFHVSTISFCGKFQQNCCIKPIVRMSLSDWLTNNYKYMTPKWARRNYYRVFTATISHHENWIFLIEAFYTIHLCKHSYACSEKYKNAKYHGGPCHQNIIRPRYMEAWYEIELWFWIWWGIPCTIIIVDVA